MPAAVTDHVLGKRPRSHPAACRKARDGRQCVPAAARAACRSRRPLRARTAQRESTRRVRRRRKRDVGWHAPPLHIVRLILDQRVSIPPLADDI
jgi:hypothetical protein